MTAFTRTAAFSLVAAALLGLTLSPVSAQGGPGRPSTPVGLGLDAAQQAKASARQAQFQKDVTALRTDTKMTDAQKQAKYKILYAAMDKDMMALLTPAQHFQVDKQRQINIQFQKDVLALQADKKLTDAQKKARYLQITETARNASLALMTPAQRAEAIKRSAAAEAAQKAQAAKIAEARSLGQQLQKSETPAQSAKLSKIALTAGAAIQAVIANKTLSDQAKTAKIIALRKDALSRDLALLNPAQRSLYQRIQALITSPSAPR